MADTEEKIRITPSKTDVDGKLLSILESNLDRFDISNTDFLNSGSWGYIKDTLSMAIRDSAYYKTYLEREHNLSTAVSAKAIHNHARKWDIDVLLATPAFVHVYFTIPINELSEKISYLVDSSSTSYTNYGLTEKRCLVIDKTNPIIADDVYFSLEHSIAIIDTSATVNNDTNLGQSYTVKYCVDENNKTTEFSDYSNSIINSSVYTSNGVQYLVFTATAYQYKTVTTVKSITSTNSVSSKIFNFEFDNQIGGMTIEYSKGTTNYNVDLYFSNIRSKIATNNMYAYYSLTDNNTIEINFMNGEAGLPQNGGKLTFKAFETLGSGGNITYTGDVILNVTDNLISDLPITLSFVDGESIGGKDAPSLDSIKELIISKITTRDTIITESDLNKFLTNQTSIFNTINGTALEFNKERDDIIKRSFVASLMTRTSDSTNQLNNAVIPTNTIDVVIPITTINTLNNAREISEISSLQISPNNNIYYDTTNSVYTLSNNSSGPVYNTPFNISLNLNKFKKCGYSYLATNDSCELTYASISSLNNILLPSTCKIYKNISDNSTSNSNPYTLSFYVTSDIALSNASLMEANDFLKLTVYLTDTAYATYSVPKSAITVSIESDNDTSATLKQYRIDITLYYQQIDANGIKVAFPGDSNTSILLSETVKFGITINTYSDNNYTSVSLIGRNFLNVYTELDDIMSSDIKINTDSSGNVTELVVKSVPVVANYWIKSNNKDSFIEQLMVYINILKENANKLELNTSFNLKFTNTYGTSYYYDSISTNIRLKLNIYLNSNTVANYSTSELSSLINEIRSSIRNLVDISNEEKELSVSKIEASILSMYYDYIAHIDFVSLNGTFNQYIKQTSLASNSAKLYPVEYFNLDTTLDSNGISQLEKDILFFNASNKTLIVI